MRGDVEIRQIAVEVADKMHTRDVLRPHARHDPVALLAQPREHQLCLRPQLRHPAPRLHDPVLAPAALEDGHHGDERRITGQTVPGAERRATALHLPPVEPLEVHGPAFSYLLDRISYTRWQRTLTDRQKEQVRGVVMGRALFNAPRHQVYTRVATDGKGLYVDLGTPDWSVVQISPSGWQVLRASPVRFRRSPSTAALPVPEPGGMLSDLRPYIYARDEDFLVIVAFILACFRPTGPYPIFEIVGNLGKDDPVLWPQAAPP